MPSNIAKKRNSTPSMNDMYNSIYGSAETENINDSSKQSDTPNKSSSSKQSDSSNKSNSKENKTTKTEGATPELETKESSQPVNKPTANTKSNTNLEDMSLKDIPEYKRPDLNMVSYYTSAEDEFKIKMMKSIVKKESDERRTKSSFVREAIELLWDVRYKNKL